MRVSLCVVRCYVLLVVCDLLLFDDCRVCFSLFWIVCNCSVYCSLSDDRCSLIVVCCVFFAARYTLLVGVLLFVVCYLLFVLSFVLLVVLLFCVVCCVVFVVRCLQCVACCL